MQPPGSAREPMLGRAAERPATAEDVLRRTVAATGRCTSCRRVDLFWQLAGNRRRARSPARHIDLSTCGPAVRPSGSLCSSSRWSDRGPQAGSPAAFCRTVLSRCQRFRGASCASITRSVVISTNVFHLVSQGQPPRPTRRPRGTGTSQYRICPHFVVL